MMCALLVVHQERSRDREHPKEMEEYQLTPTETIRGGKNV